jgi:hypothetical protein
MRVVDQITSPEAEVSTSPGGDAGSADDGDWAEQTRAVLTRDLLLRAVRAQPGEARALEFRALHLNLPLVGEVGERLGLTAAQLGEWEHDAIDGLLEAVRAFDPQGETPFRDVATAYVERRLLHHPRRPAPLPRRRPVRLAVHRVALAIAGCRV